MRSTQSKDNRVQKHRGALRVGFTYVELLAVMLIIGILATTAAPKFADATHQQRVRAAAFRMAAELNLSRHDAKTKGISREVLFTVGSNRYDLLGMTHPDKPGALYRVELDEGAYPVELLAAEFVNADDTKDKIKFDMYGRPSVDSKPIVSGTVTVESDGETASVIVNPVTGKADVQ